MSHFNACQPEKYKNHLDVWGEAEAMSLKSFVD
jgi:hypothetical protein